ncbi:unnamed protein product [Rotaria sp. Silwood2]|nr:unnamed protein product [Rotaria sp. Silwood2]CAF2688973.1 unnamed protein product [Rotaria sp. Silwood2]CAF3098703.1 unnamed protein product [Rotaria sp. Silwood2]CAF3863864.1 unnamed protein product [Rotaria sp. Silwood2]CAF3975426.1 unnamed protein product [Rotaria sp. Silwood2]
MPHLNQFIFNIRSAGHFIDVMSFPSNDDIYRTFTSFKDYQVISCVDYFPKAEYVQCHIYSCPYTLTHYNNITNNFPGGLFNNVQEIELFDERPFEHEFFIRISQAFPFLKVLFIVNKESQTFKQEQESKNNDNRNFSFIEYSHLITLGLINVHDDYAEQFLFDTKTCLSNYIRLGIDYHQLQRVTLNFTRNATRNNCSKIKQLILHEYLDLPKQYNTYFPNLE